MISRQKFLDALGLPLLILFFFLPAIVEAASADKSFSVRWQQNRLSVVANGAPLRDVLAEVARQTGLEVTGIKALKRESRGQFSDLLLRDAVKKLLGNVNYAILENGAGANGDEHLVVMVLGDSAPSSARESSVIDKSSDEKPLPKRPLTPDEYAVAEADNLHEAADRGDLGALRRAAAKGDPVAQSVALQLLSSKDPDHAKRLAIAAATSTDLDRRLSGLQVLADIDAPDSTATLGAALKDPALAVRQAALTGLVSQTEPQTVALMVEATRDRDPSIRLQALEFLSQRGADGEAGLTQALGSPDSEVQSRARELLDQMNPTP
ncbi:MAG: HEAT repeat domain-containing protein [Candidatus Binatus sp.]|uniref:HEAT repeat domain-containing protein n=1 Tax=Candidatus Binatus sp. TaxID=2811406 RepID=UPI002719EDD1|nr:HEAT repeat domain-containing protein [Candidatus Binatus sp.]MDO8430805.1 HEAT repeat domain-containing protein [Candidatus Binatus sp.]